MAERVGPLTLTSADRRYRAFWQRVGEDFPDLAGARSTDQYRRDEQWLLTEAIGDLRGQRVLKTDLWDEARNTRILGWAAERGAIAVGIDLSSPVVHMARDDFGAQGRVLHASVADVRDVPLRDGSVDIVYSMGTIEHFPETDRAVAEIYRVLRPGGVAIVGVPNRLDPFLRPLLVAFLHRFGWYGYGDEKSYTRRQLRRMLQAAGFTVESELGILFVPGYLRMAELACHAWVPRLAPVFGALVAPFAALSERFPVLRRYGYLLATVARKPC